MKRIVPGLLCVVIVLCALVLTPFPAEAATSGVTGSCTWSLDGTVLTISGNGKMANYYGLNFHTNAPWGYEITQVIIEDGVTNISQYAFYGCSELQTISIPGSVQQIDKHAFDYSGLTSITLPEGLTKIGEGAFNQCTSLRSVTLPNSLTEIGDWAFQSCPMTSIVISKNVKHIGYCAFNYCCLEEVWYLGNQNDKKEINIEDFNGGLYSATWYYDSCLVGAPHAYDHDCDSDCNNCGEFRSPQHGYAADCAWYCGICGACRENPGIAHTLGEGAVCTLCDEQWYYIGDVTRDGRVNMGDAARLYSHIRGTKLIEDLVVLAVADANGDGKINMGDTARILAHAKGANPLF